MRQTAWDLFYWFGTIALTGMVLSFVLLIWLRTRITAGEPEKLHAIARARFKAHPTGWSRVILRIPFVATRAAMPYGILAFALVLALPGIVALAAVGANVYWGSLVLKLQHLLNEQQFRRVSPLSRCAFASVEKRSRASRMVGMSGFLTTPISPVASQSRTRPMAADHDRRSSARRMYSPRRDPWTQIGQLQLR